MRLIDADLLRKQFRQRELERKCRYMNGAMICNVRKVIDEAPTVERPHGKWEYLKEHITEMRDADGELNQKQTCQFILNLMGVIEKEGERNEM